MGDARFTHETEARINEMYADFSKGKPAPVLTAEQKNAQFPYDRLTPEQRVTFTLAQWTAMTPAQQWGELSSTQQYALLTPTQRASFTETVWSSFSPQAQLSMMPAPSPVPLINAAELETQQDRLRAYQGPKNAQQENEQRLSQPVPLTNAAQLKAQQDRLHAYQDAQNAQQETINAENEQRLSQ